jgi:glycosyltransferase involved in cell wall biosynthesis
MTAGLGVIIPAYNEQERIDRCLEAVLRAANHPLLEGVAVRIVAVLDSCNDGTGHRVERVMSRLPKGRDIDLVAVEVAHTNVGMARAAGCAKALGLLAGVDIGDAWLATTDADSIVPANWLAHQVRLHRAGLHAWAGTVEVADWGDHGPEVIRRHDRLYQRDDLPGGRHRHAHGANLGVSAQAYCRCGGFSDAACGEDRALLQALAIAGLPGSATSAMPVLTSARRDPRAPGGFGDTLGALGQDQLGRLGQDQVDIAELVPQVALGQGRRVRALE